MATRPTDLLKLLRSQVAEAGQEGGLKCYYKPRRRFPRRFTAKAAARAVCAAVAAGSTPAEIRLEMAECVPCQEDRRRSNTQRQALDALLASNNTLELFGILLQALQTSLRSVSFVARFVPQARPALLLLAPLERRVSGVLGQVVAQRAANDSVIRILRIAA